MPAVTVITATYNRATLLPRAIESVLAQTYQDWELIIVDDGSTDGTPEVGAAAQQRDRRIRMVRGSHRGLAAARNTGLAHAQGRYVAFLDDDDIVLPGKLAHQVQVLEHRPELGFIYSLVRHEDTQGRTFNVPREPGRAFNDLFQGQAPYVHGVLVRRSAIERAGGFRDHLPFCEDYDLWLRIAAAAPFDYTREVVAICYRHPGNMSRAVASLAEVELSVLAEILEWRRLGVPAAMRRRRLALLSYDIARRRFDGGDYQRAAAAFFRAVCWRPDVGLLARAYRSQPRQGSLRKLLKPYLAIPYCALRCAVPHRAGAAEAVR
ncbi:MAG: glycosyltransferase [Candidatus Omnitrophica bacterium]|nr:glycosyltransferase [Candidatus Omnitrophota bacterium]